MKIIDFQLNFDDIRNRIELDKSQYRAGKWAELLKVSESLISNIHGGKKEKKKKKQNPTLPYIIAVARAMKKPVEYYLYGDSEQILASAATEKPPDNTDSKDTTETVIAQKILEVLTDIKNANLVEVINNKIELVNEKLDRRGIELNNVITLLERLIILQSGGTESKKEVS
jgi:hypothetical protein